MSKVNAPQTSTKGPTPKELLERSFNEAIKRRRDGLKTVFSLLAIGAAVGGVVYYLKSIRPPLENKFVIDERESTMSAAEPKISVFERFLDKEDWARLRGSEPTESEEQQNQQSAETEQPETGHTEEEATTDVEELTAETLEPLTFPSTYEIPQATHVYQTFNNCGPATLSMALSYFGVIVDQKTLGESMRPYQHPRGDNDDKTIFTHEFSTWAEKYGLDKNLQVVNRPNGSLTLLKLFISNDIPVVVKSWLSVGEDIGHFRIARGYDDNKRVIIQDDSYKGPNKKIPYFDFLSMWQPFNYNYIVLYTPEQQKLVERILSEELVETTAWTNTRLKAEQEAELDPQNIYPIFNLAVAHYYLGEYQQCVNYFEQVESKLPRRMLWYQIEPILAYQQLKKYDHALALIETILSDSNRAFAELYQIRGEIYLDQGKTEEAKQEFETAVFYNENYQPAKDALAGL